MLGDCGSLINSLVTFYIKCLPDSPICGKFVMMHNELDVYDVLPYTVYHPLRVSLSMPTFCMCGRDRQVLYMSAHVLCKYVYFHWLYTLHWLSILGCKVCDCERLGRCPLYVSLEILSVHTPQYLPL